MAITSGQVGALREKTGAGMMDCKRALEEAGGNEEKAIELLRKQGLAAAEKRSGRATKEGLIASYIHPGGRIGVLVEVNCETDFVARTEVFQQFVKDVTMQVAAASPRWLGQEDVPQAVIAKEREIYAEQYKDKPAKALEGIIGGKLKKFYAQVCLLEQPFIKDPDISVGEYLKRTVASTGENVKIRRFVRFELGEDLADG